MSSPAILIVAEHIGGALTLSGTGFRCAAPQGALFPRASVILYRPGVGFTIFAVPVLTNGTYRRVVTVPPQLTAASALNGSPARLIPTVPGAYYLAVRLVDVATPPPAQADAALTVLAATPPTAATPTASAPAASGPALTSVLSGDYGGVGGPAGAGHGRYSVALVDGRGRVAARVSAASRTAIATGGGPGGGASAVPLPPVSASRTRLYVLDGDRRVLSLSPSGAVAPVTRLPGGPGVRAAFAVSPDDRRIAVGVLTYSPTPGHAGLYRLGTARARLYVEDLRGGHRVALATPPGVYAWPVGWHDGALILALDSRPDIQNTTPNPYGATGGFALVDAAGTGRRLAALCADKAPAIAVPLGPLTPAGALCARGGATATTPYLDTWAGAARRLPGALPGSLNAALAPDGRRVAVEADGTETVVVQDSRGRHATTLSGVPAGWIDAERLVVTQYTASSGRTDPTRVLDLRSGASVIVQLPAVYQQGYGALPGGF